MSTIFRYRHSLTGSTRENDKRRNNESPKSPSRGVTVLKPEIKTLCVRVFLILVYLCFGALIFCAIEHKTRDKTFYRRKLGVMKTRLEKKYNITPEELNEFESTVEKKVKEIKAAGKEWDYYQSLYFASTVTTTIGTKLFIYF